MNVLRQPAINSLRHLKLSGRPKFRQFNSWPRLLSVAPLKPATKVPVGESKVLLGKLFGLVWAERDTKIKVRILFAFGLLLAGKSCMVLTPLIYKQIIDTCNAAPNEALTMLGLLCGGYGLARLSAFAFQEFRNAVFASVSQRTMRTISKRVYNHLLYLDQEFHSSSVTGGLLRSIDRGTKGINQVLSALVFHIIPTTFELSIVCGLLYSYFGVEYMVITFATVALYSIFTVVTTRWRLKFRKRMNIADNKAGAKATDTLLNIEQIQLMNSQPFATEQYDKALMDYETAAVKSITSLSFLNAGQSTIFSIALGLQLYMASEGVITGSMTVGDVVMINSLLFQLSFPLNFLGSVYRDTRQSLVDMKTMFELLEIKSKIIDSRKLSKFEYKNGDIYLDDVYFQYDDGRQVLHGLSLHIPAGKTVAFVGNLCLR